MKKFIHPTEIVIIALLAITLILILINLINNIQTSRKITQIHQALVDIELIETHYEEDNQSKK